MLVACVGYRYLRDLSVGPTLFPALSELPWPVEVEVCDLHFGPIHMVHWLEERRFERIVFVAAVERGRASGTLTVRRWQGTLPDGEAIQRAVGEGVSGVIDLDNLLIVGTYFKAMPPDVIVVEIEPAETGWGADLSPRIAAMEQQIMATVQRVAIHGYHDEST